MFTQLSTTFAIAPTKRFHFNQAVMTPKGKATFIAYVDDGTLAQVSRFVPCSTMTRDECRRYKPAIDEMSDAEFSAWQKSAKILRNEIYRCSQISDSMS